MEKEPKSHRTRFVPLCSAQTESPMSTLSPRENGSPPPFAMADPMADFRKSMAAVLPMWQLGELFGVSGVRKSGRPMAKGSMFGRVSGFDR